MLAVWHVNLVKRMLFTMFRKSRHSDENKRYLWPLLMKNIMTNKWVPCVMNEYWKSIIYNNYSECKWNICTDSICQMVHEIIESLNWNLTNRASSLHSLLRRNLKKKRKREEGSFFPKHAVAESITNQQWSEKTDWQKKSIIFRIPPLICICKRNSSNKAISENHTVPFFLLSCFVIIFCTHFLPGPMFFPNLMP